VWRIARKREAGAIDHSTPHRHPAGAVVQRPQVNQNRRQDHALPSLIQTSSAAPRSGIRVRITEIPHHPAHHPSGFASAGEAVVHCRRLLYVTFPPKFVAENSGLGDRLVATGRGCMSPEGSPSLSENCGESPPGPASRSPEPAPAASAPRSASITRVVTVSAKAPNLEIPLR
jgi:hypothetical protein